MHPALSEDLARLSELLAHAHRFAVETLEAVDERPAAVPPAAVDTAPLPQRGLGGEATLDLFQRRWADRFSGSAGARYLGFVTGGATPAAVAGDWLASTFDQNVVTRTDSAAPELERETVGWLRELLGLPQRFTGNFVSGATMSNLVGLAVGREWLGERRGVSVAESGVGALGDVAVLSGSPHSSIHKALSMLGMGRDSVRRIATRDGRESIDVERLAAELERTAGRPTIVVANAGTVNTGDFDEVRAIAELRRRFGFWLHVDGAFGAFTALSPENATLVEGMAEADSVCVDLHKWLNVPYDSAVQFNSRQDLQVRVFQNAASYVGLPAADPDFVHLAPESSRRLRALPAWFSISAYGADGHREIVERTISVARALGDRISGVAGLRLLAPVRLNIVCFTIAEDPTVERVDRLVRAIAHGGETFVTPTIHNGTPAVRAAVSSWRTTGSDVDRIVEAIVDATEREELR
ncbi:pyridoxal phosphate-dependent decarboxylase family protein [Parasphingorhabdus pacifica]